MSTAQKPKFNKRIFWDVVFESLDYDAKASFVIEKPFVFHLHHTNKLPRHVP